MSEKFLKKLYDYKLRKLFLMFFILRGLDALTAYGVFLLDSERFVRAEINRAFIQLVTIGEWYPQIQLEIAFFLIYFMGLYLCKLGIKQYLEKESIDDLAIIGFGTAVSFTVVIWFTTLGIVSNILAMIMFLVA